LQKLLSICQQKYLDSYAKSTLSFIGNRLRHEMSKKCYRPHTPALPQVPNILGFPDFAPKVERTWHSSPVKISALQECRPMGSRVTLIRLRMDDLLRAGGWATPLRRVLGESRIMWIWFLTLSLFHVQVPTSFRKRRYQHPYQMVLYSLGFLWFCIPIQAQLFHIFGHYFSLPSW
jgi:hypothetical protein